jgi:signal peptidase II
MTISTIQHRSILWGCFTRIGLAAAVLDQASKLWLIFVTDLGSRGPVAIEYRDQLWPVPAARPAPPVGTARAQGDCSCGSGLRAHPHASRRLRSASSSAARSAMRSGAVADFVLFHITTASLNFRWYVFNIADVAIVIGVSGLIYEMLLGGEGTRNDAKGPRLTPQIDLATFRRKIDVLRRVVKGAPQSKTPPGWPAGALQRLRIRGSDYGTDSFPLRDRC